MGIEKRRQPKKRYFLFFIGGLLIFLFYVWECAEVVTLSYQINELKRELRLLENKNRAIKTKLHHYTNLANIDKIAQEKKEMVFPQHENILFLEVNFKQNRTSTNKAFFIAQEDSKGASKNSHY
ncbi:Cell division protein FtsL [subsurface metagenome]